MESWTVPGNEARDNLLQGGSLYFEAECPEPTVYFKVKCPEGGGYFEVTCPPDILLRGASYLVTFFLQRRS